MATKLTPEEIAAKEKLGIKVPSFDTKSIAGVLPSVAGISANMDRNVTGIASDIASGNYGSALGRSAKNVSLALGVIPSAKSDLADSAVNSLKSGADSIGAGLNNFYGEVKNGFSGPQAPVTSKVDAPSQSMIDAAKRIGLESRGIQAQPAQPQPAQQPVGIQVPSVQAAPEPQALTTKIDQPAFQPSNRVSPTWNNPYIGKPNVSIDANGVTQITGQPTEARPTGVSGYAPAAPQFIKIDPNTMSFADIAAARSQNKITQANMDQGIKVGNLDANNQQNANTLRLGLLNADLTRMNADSSRMNANTSQKNSDLQAQELGFKIGNYGAEQAAKQARDAIQNEKDQSQIAVNKSTVEMNGRKDEIFPSSLQKAFFDSEAMRLGDGNLALQSLEQARAQRSGAKVNQSGDLQVGPATPAVGSSRMSKEEAMAKIKKEGNNPDRIKQFESIYGPYKS